MLDTSQSCLSSALKIVSIEPFIVDIKLHHHRPSSSPSPLYPRKFIIISQSVSLRFPSFNAWFASTRRALSGRIVCFCLRCCLLNHCRPDQSPVFQQHLDVSCSNIRHLPSPRSCFRSPFISLSLCHYIPAAFYLISSLFHIFHHFHAPILEFLSPSFIHHHHQLLSLIENQGDGFSFISLPSVEGSPVFLFHCFSRLPPSTLKCLKLLVWLGRWLRTVTISSWEEMMSRLGFCTRK